MGYTIKDVIHRKKPTALKTALPLSKAEKK